MKFILFNSFVSELNSRVRAADTIEFNLDSALTNRLSVSLSPHSDALSVSPEIRIQAALDSIKSDNLRDMIQMQANCWIVCIGNTSSDNMSLSDAVSQIILAMRKAVINIG